MATEISVLGANVQSRLEEYPLGAPGVWWSLQYEIYSALEEACNDLMLLVGRPTQEVLTNFDLVPNSVWQTIPKGLLLITDIQAANGPLYKVNLWDMDYLQTSWGSDWQEDVDAVPRRWFPIGFNMFGIHPAVSLPQTVQITAIQYPTSDVWPYDGTETVPFETNYFELLEEYAAHYCRIKEMGGEFEQGMKLFNSYLQGAQRMTAIQDRRDPLIFSSGYGATGRTNPTTMR